MALFLSPRTLAFLFFSIFLALYCSIDPFNHCAISDFPDFVAHDVGSPRPDEVLWERDTQNSLQKSEILFMNQIQGPESVAFDPQGRGPYTGVADGRVLFWDGEKWTEFAYTSNNRSAICDPKPSSLSYLRNEHICGRPLGLRFDKRSGELYIADAYMGLMKVGPEGGLAMPLVTEVEGVPLRFTNDLDIDDDGTVYFTDSSTNYQRRNFVQLILSGDNSGRVVKYDPVAKKAVVLVSNVQFPNGVSISKDGSFFVFCEGDIGRLRRYWLKGEKAGSSDVFAMLPGHPDNVRTNKNGEFWVALHCRRNYYSYMMARYPKLRMFILKLPITAKMHYLFQIGIRPHGLVAKYSPQGKLIKVFEDSQGKVVRSVSEVEEKDGKLWMGSVLMNFIAVYDL